MINDKYHRQVLKELKKLKSNSKQKERLWVQHYLGSDRPSKCIKTSLIKESAKKFADKNTLSFKEFISLLNSLYKNAISFEEIDFAARLIKALPKFKQQINPKHLDNWLKYTHGWAEIDLLCQSNFESQQLLSNWPQWKKILKEFNKSPEISKRRASLVLLTKSLSQSDDPCLSELAFKNIENLKSEPEVLITKAVSWLLRSLIKYHSQEVKKYLNKNQDSLPKIAYRETLRKLNTGRK